MRVTANRVSLRRHHSHFHHHHRPRQLKEMSLRDVGRNPAALRDRPDRGTVQVTVENANTHGRRLQVHRWRHQLPPGPHPHHQRDVEDVDIEK